jgi:hypothetical protein
MTTATVTELPPQIGAEAMAGSAKERWASGDLYEPYVGRWSRLVARDFLHWLEAPAGLDWLDVGCGTGALAEAIAEGFAPKHLPGVDPSAEFLEFARQRLRDRRPELARPMRKTCRLQTPRSTPSSPASCSTSSPTKPAWWPKWRVSRARAAKSASTSGTTRERWR